MEEWAVQKSVLLPGCFNECILEFLKREKSVFFPCIVSLDIYILKNVNST